MDLRDELIQGLLKEYAALGRIREKLAIQLEALGVDVNAPVMSLPYKDVSSSVEALMKKLKTPPNATI